jgi:L-ascorbate 6-phosphate lactonase
VYHSSDTAFCDLLLKACPKADVFLPCINGKFGNLSVEQAVSLTKAVAPRYVIPHHYDVMALNSENPESFRYFYSEAGLKAECRILKVLEEFTWE